MKREIAILSPVVLGVDASRPLAPRLATLAGKRLGIRRDHAWRSFDVFSEELALLATQRSGVSGIELFDPESRIGTPERESAKVAAFARPRRRSGGRASALEGPARRGVSTTPSSVKRKASRRSSS
jgi:hypothetical protein